MTVSGLGSRAIDLIYIDESWGKNSGQGGSIWKFMKATEKNAVAAFWANFPLGYPCW